jgi:hypothetical protein
VSDGWKVPDWRDPAQYPHPRDCSLRQWAWEFHRRNPDYRALWREHIEPSFRFQDQGVGLVGPAHGVPADEQAELVHRFGLDSFPPSPDDDRPPLFIRSGLRYTARREARLLHPEQIAVVLDLKRPVERQVAAVRTLIVRERKKIGHKEHRNRIREFVRYLRVLDGDDAKASDTEIGAALFRKPSQDRILSAVRDQDQILSAVRDHRRAATRLRDTDYLLVAIS